MTERLPSCAWCITHIDFEHPLYTTDFEQAKAWVVRGAEVVALHEVRGSLAEPDLRALTDEIRAHRAGFAGSRESSVHPSISELLRDISLSARAASSLRLSPCTAGTPRQAASGLGELRLVQKSNLSSLTAPQTGPARPRPLLFVVPACPSKRSGPRTGGVQ